MYTILPHKPKTLKYTASMSRGISQLTFSYSLYTYARPSPRSPRRGSRRPRQSHRYQRGIPESEDLYRKIRGVVRWPLETAPVTPSTSTIASLFLPSSESKCIHRPVIEVDVRHLHVLLQDHVLRPYTLDHFGEGIPHQRDAGDGDDYCAFGTQLFDFVLHDDGCQR